LAAADRARTRWVRVKSNFSLSAYEVVEATGQLSDPQWPAESLQLLIEIAFRDRVINSLDHPVICRLRGEL
jgi:hypothetical protein